MHADGSVTALVGLQPGSPAGTLVFVGPDGRVRGSREVTHATGLGPHPSGSLLLRARCGATAAGLELSVLGADGVERSRRCVEGPPTAKLAVDEAGNSFLVGGRARLALDITALAPDGGLRGVARLDGCASGDEPRLSAARGELLLRCQGDFGRLFLAAIAFDR